MCRRPATGHPATTTTPATTAAATGTEPAGAATQATMIGRRRAMSHRTVNTLAGVVGLLVTIAGLTSVVGPFRYAAVTATKASDHAHWRDATTLVLALSLMLLYPLTAEIIRLTRRPGTRRRAVTPAAAHRRAERGGQRYARPPWAYRSNACPGPAVLAIDAAAGLGLHDSRPGRTLGQARAGSPQWTRGGGPDVPQLGVALNSHTTKDPQGARDMAMARAPWVTIATIAT